MLPGISKKMFSKLKKDDAAAAKTHIGNVIRAIKIKKDLLEGRIEEFGKERAKPQDEAKTLLQLIKKAESSVDSNVLSVLLALEVNVRDLLNSIAEEQKLVKSLSAKKAVRFKDIEKEIEGELILAYVVEHQMNLIVSIRNLANSVLKSLNSFPKSLRGAIGRNIESLSDIVSYLFHIIADTELANLEVAYNMFEVERWPEMRTRIDSIRAKFLDLQEHQF